MTQRSLPHSRLTLDEAVDLTRTGDLWLFRGTFNRRPRDPADDQRPGEPRRDGRRARRPAAADVARRAGQGPADVWTGSHHRGVQLHDLRAAVEQWTGRYEQDAWLRQLDAEITHEMEDAVLRTIARLNGTPFPSTAALAGRWLRGRARRAASAELTYCAEVVAATYTAMGLLPATDPRTSTIPADSGQATTWTFCAAPDWEPRSRSSPEEPARSDPSRSARANTGSVTHVARARPGRPRTLTATSRIHRPGSGQVPAGREAASFVSSASPLGRGPRMKANHPLVALLTTAVLARGRPRSGRLQRRRGRRGSESVAARLVGQYQRLPVALRVRPTGVPRGLHPALGGIGEHEMKARAMRLRTSEPDLTLAVRAANLANRVGGIYEAGGFVETRGWTGRVCQCRLHPGTTLETASYSLRDVVAPHHLPRDSIKSARILEWRQGHLPRHLGRARRSWRRSRDRDIRFPE